MRENDMQQVLQQYLASDISLDVFLGWFAGAYVSVRENCGASAESRILCSQIVVRVAEFSRGHRSEEELRRQLKAYAHHFVPIRVIVNVKRLVFGKSPIPALSSTVPREILVGV